MLQKQLSYATGQVEIELLKLIVKLQTEQGSKIVKDVHPGAKQALNRWNKRSFSLAHAQKVRKL